MPYSTVSSDTRGGLGGTCVLRGCVPKKLLVYGSEFSKTFKDAAGFGWATANAELPGASRHEPLAANSLLSPPASRNL